MLSTKGNKGPSHVSSSNQTRLAYKMQAQTLLATKSIADMGQEHSRAKVLKPLLLQRPLANIPLNSKAICHKLIQIGRLPNAEVCSTMSVESLYKSTHMGVLSAKHGRN